MFEKLPTQELKAMQEVLHGDEFHLARALVSRELAKRSMEELLQNNNEEALDAIRNDITGIYDAIDGTPAPAEHPEDSRWI